MDAILGAAALLRERPDVCFHFYGSGPEKELSLIHI